MHHFKLGAVFFRVCARHIHHFRHEFEAFRVGERHIEAKARHQRHEGVRHGERTHVFASARPGDHKLAALELVMKLFLDGEEIGNRLGRVPEVALHVIDRNLGKLCQFLHPLVAADERIAYANAMSHAGEHFDGVLRGLAVVNLRRLGRKVVRMTAKLGDAALERVARTSGFLKEQHKQRFVLEPFGVEIERIAHLELACHRKERFQFFVRPVLLAKQVFALESCLHVKFPPVFFDLFLNWISLP
ncbi:hypothetical protein SDC9_108361 [bioreactor metagenome]|uniref:Uncharacterized protein n=1 Tax=bioreactor metagenome TaxID=1076179 RepID=A0A645BA24_9ZZZZ